MKKVYLLSLLLAAGMLHAQESFTNVSGSLAWPVGNEGDATATENIAGALQTSRVSVGSDLEVITRSDYQVNNGNMMVVYQPGTSNAGAVATDMIEYSVTMKKGITFQLTSAEYDALKDGTDGATYSWSYTVDGVESSITKVDNTKLLRNNGNNSETAQLHHTESITAAAGRTITFRLYVSDVASNKKLAFSNVKLTGLVNGAPVVRTFQNFSVDLRAAGADTLFPAAVSVTGGTFHDAQHGYSSLVLTVPVDGPVKFTFGGCQYTNTLPTVSIGDNLLATINTKAAGCDSRTSFDHYVTWVYNEETPATLTINGGEYLPYLMAEACDQIPTCYVTYYNTDGKTVLGVDTVQGNSPLAYKFGESDVTIASGYAFRGWFNATQSTALKVAEGTAIQQDMNLYAKTTPIEVPTNTARFIYDLAKANFYIEDHECISVEGGSFHDGQHGWAFGANGKIMLPVAGKALITIGNCKYSDEGALATVTDAAGTEVDTFSVKVATDGEEHVIRYEGGATTLTISFSGTTYVHKVTVYNVIDFVEKDEATGYYIIPAGDANSFLLALAAANATGDAKIFLPNGVYDLGELCLTAVSGNNISIVGESMNGTIIRNAPLVENEGIGTTATLLNTSNGLYLQDLTLHNDMDFFSSAGAGRAVALQDNAGMTICKNVRLMSYQDTYYSHKASNFYWEDCEIQGCVDYLCGDGNVVYNRVALVNKSRSKSGSSGSDVICAPYCTATTDARFNWGYVFLDCSIRSECQNFTFARSWGGESKAAFIRTTLLDNTLSDSRWTKEGMNVAATAFKEYGTMDANGNVICPTTKVIKFTHSTGDKEYETILSNDEAAQFTIVNIFGNWAPDQTAAQVTPDTVYLAANGDLSWTGNAPAYLVEHNGKTEIVSGNSCPVDANASNVTVRAANGRGGFGPACAPGHHSALEQLKADESIQKFIENGQVVIEKNGVKYNVLGTVIR